MRHPVSAGPVKTKADGAVAEAKRIEQEVTDKINETSHNLDGLIAEKDVEVDQVKAILNGTLKESLKGQDCDT